MSFNALYPINLKLCDRLCVVVGGGNVALRKIKSLIACGAAVRVVSPYILADLKKIIMGNHLEWLEREYVEGDLRGAFLAFAATSDPEVQQQVKEETEKYKIILNSADDPVGSDFHVPAHFRRGEMLVTVSTSGSSPALSKQIREWLEQEIGQEYEAVVGFLAMVRDAVASRGTGSTSHKELFQNLLKIDIVKMIRDGNWFDLQMVLLQELPEDVDSVALIRRFLDAHDKKKG
jgi:precorrin-2 dehydrogenase/sirohydrochlorin ferrochelatase